MNVAVHDLSPTCLVAHKAHKAHKVAVYKQENQVFECVVNYVTIPPFPLWSQQIQDGGLQEKAYLINIEVFGMKYDSPETEILLVLSNE